MSDKVEYVYIPMPELKKVDCNKCKNNNSRWCSGCDYNFQHPDNFDFYQPIE